MNIRLARGGVIPGGEGHGGRRSATGGASPASGTTDGKGNGGKAKRPKIDFKNVRAEAGHIVREHRRTLTIGMALMLVNRLCQLVMPAMPKFFFDDVIGKGQTQLLVPLVLAAAAAALIQATTSFTLSQVVSVAAQGAIARMRKDVEAHVLRLPVSYFDSTKTGVLISRIMTDPEGIRNLVGTGLVQLVGGLVTAVLAFGILLYLNARLTLGTIFLLLAFAGATSIAFKKLRPIFRKRGEINAEVTGRLNETLGGIRLVKTYVAEEREGAVFGEGVDRLFRNVASSITGTSLVGAFSTLIVGGIGVLILLVGGRSVIAGQMSTGDLVSYLLYIGVMAAPLVQISSISTQISEAFAGLDRIHELRQVTGEDDEDDEREALPDIAGEVVFDDVWFQYKPDTPVLKGISFQAPAGTTTALVGPSGAGKSTLIGLVMAFYRPLKGHILVDGNDLTTLKLRDYREFLGVVMQDNFLFDGTVRENIAFSSPDATDADIREAAHIAHCDEFVERFDEKYDTIVGERGVKLSGGQRQRVGIARAILANPRVLILDEATSSLDSEAEALIQDGLRTLRRGRTTFVIAHRLSTIRSADQILVMDEGEVVERGTHPELIQMDGLYRRLYEKQHGLVEDLFINPGEEPQPDATLPPDMVRGVGIRR
ncbi:MAG: ABC transporter ATP-binding protein/permease [Gemmatimonadetes bacterium]|nr:ABC transporter ATP-binding protein/permease [Gemmatimonadota bacterium]